MVESLAHVPAPTRRCENVRHLVAAVLVATAWGLLCGCARFVESEDVGPSTENRC
jgi:hypothetical protein